MNGKPGLAFRYATAADAPAVRALIERAYRGEESAGSWTSEAHLLKGMRTRPGEIETLIAGTDTRFVLAEEAGEVVGCALIERRDGYCYFGMFAVRPDRQAGGVGRAVLNACEDAARDVWRSPEMRMTVISLRTDLIAYYERRGFVRTGETVTFPFADWTGETTRDFDLRVLAKRLE